MKDALNLKSYNPVFVRVLNKFFFFDLIEPESSFGDGSWNYINGSLLSISKTTKYVFHPVLVTYTL